MPLDTLWYINDIKRHSLFLFQPSTSRGPVPPPSPVHRRSPIPRPRVPDDDDMVSETTDSTMVIRMTPRIEGEEILSVEVGPGEGVEVEEEEPSKT